jgi:site-specific DNA-adenine methylase
MNALVAGYVLNELGFQFAPKSNISQLLKKISPTGGTAFRDSLIGGCNLLIKLYQILQKTGASDHWNFVQVILTDGAD